MLINLRGLILYFLLKTSSSNSFIAASALLRYNITICCPEGYEPNEGILSKSRELGQNKIDINHDPASAVKDADVIYTDVWVSMGQENESENKENIFQPYQINSNLLDSSKENIVIMHCLPAHRGEEITDEVFSSPNSVVFDQAENKLHAGKAILEYFIKN